MRIVLKPYWIAEECFLYEALMWAGFNRFPLSELVSERADYRFDSDAQDEYQPRVPDEHGLITSEEAMSVGLPSNPEWDYLFMESNADFFCEEFSEGNPELELSFIHSDSGRKLTKEEQEKISKRIFAQTNDNLMIEKMIQEAADREIRQAAWNEKYEEYIEVVKTKLFLALKEGKIKARGRLIPIPENQVRSFNDYDHQPIPSSNWRFDGIDWERSASQNTKGHYCHICLQTNQLFESFPPPTSTPVSSIQMIANQYVLDDDHIQKTVSKGKRGRPSKNWEDFYIEVMARVKKDALPEKQESFISDMQEWCLNQWGAPVGRSTILGKVSPIYKKFKGS